MTRALVLGGAKCVWEDVAALERLVGPWDGLVVACNDIACHWPRKLDAMTSLHPERIVKWKQERAKNGHPMDGCITYGRQGQKRPGVEATVQHHYGGGASGLLGVTVAQHLGADRIVCCGVPMTREPHFVESTVHQVGKQWGAADAHWRKWKQHAEKLVLTVRSMSGRTMELLGAPTPEWLGLTVKEEVSCLTT